MAKIKATLTWLRLKLLLTIALIMIVLVTMNATIEISTKVCSVEVRSSLHALVLANNAMISILVDLKDRNDEF